MTGFTLSRARTGNRRGAFGRLGAAVLLLGFLVHTGDGLMAALCHPGMEEGAGAPMSLHAPAPEVVVVETLPESPHATSTHGDRDTAGAPDARAERGDGHVPDEGDSPLPHDDPCPFGGASIAACGGSVTLAPPVVTAEAALALSDAPSPMEPRDASGVLLSLKAFRPPRG